MAKLIIKNFRAIDYAEIEIKPFTVIIGEQASGKSTISKLVYFFETIQYSVGNVGSRYFWDNLYKEIPLNDHEIDFDLIKDKCLESLKNELKHKFYDFFGSTKNELFEIKFSNNSNNLLIKPDSKTSINFNFDNSPYTIENVRNSYFFLKNLTDTLPKQELPLLKLIGFSDLIRVGIIKHLFIPASRSLITSIVPASQSKFIAEIDKRTEDNQVDFFVKSFLEDIDFFKRNYFFGKTLDDVLDEFELKTGKINPQAKLLRDKITQILKADYQNGNSGEQLIDKRFTKPVSLDKASSGQQEAVWILLTLLSLVLEEKKSFVVIEEPEAHLYPKTQAQIVEYIVQFFNAKEGNEIIITTHSPYILTVLNNLLLAKQISKKTQGTENESLAQSLDPNTWLDIDQFAAYYVGRNEQGQFIKSIVNPETGLISVNALDDASDDIMDTFDDLMDIYKSVAV